MTKVNAAQFDHPLKPVIWAGHMVYSHREFYGMLDDSVWEEQPRGSVPVPAFMKWRAEGKAKIINGKVFIKKI